MTIATVSPHSAAALIARQLRSHGVDRVFGLCGGHIMPIWMRLDAEGIRIVDVRDERAAVYMAHAHAELTGGLGVALVTAGRRLLQQHHRRGLQGPPVPHRPLRQSIVQPCPCNPRNKARRPVPSVPSPW